MTTGKDREFFRQETFDQFGCSGTAVAEIQMPVLETKLLQVEYTYEFFFCKNLYIAGFNISHGSFFKSEQVPAMQMMVCRQQGIPFFRNIQNMFCYCNV